MNNLCICSSNYTGVNCNEAATCTGLLCDVSTVTTAALSAGAIVGIFLLVLVSVLIAVFGGYKVIQKRGEVVKMQSNKNYEEEMQENDVFDEEQE